MSKSRFIIWLLTIVTCTKGTQAARPARFESTDTALQSVYRWARDMAMSYVHDGSDPVGPWYEAALPGRDAFCMRDLSHQVIGAAILGLDTENANMLGKVAANISESKDWCSYWEIDRLDRPAPCDYGNDKEFWYNLPANFDVVRACYDVYSWTADTRYLTSPVFMQFYERTVHDYADRWALTPDSIMSRRRFMNTPEPFDRRNGFHTCRGLPSYAENFSGITVAIDLLGALRRGYETYAAVATHNEKKSEADFAIQRAEAYRDIIENVWWDDTNRRYNTYYTQNSEFHRGEGVPYLLLAKAIDLPERVRYAVEDVLSRGWNVENLSAFPAFLYRLGYGEGARQIFVSLPQDKRADYPEVSFGIIEGLFCGVMGIVPSASEMSVATCYRGDAASQSSAIDVPMLGGSVTVRHYGHDKTVFTNHTPHTLVWRPSFLGDDTALYKGKKRLPASVSADIAGNRLVTAEVEVAPGKTATVSRTDR
ncbi:MAG: hypothetical protein J6J93_09535 [Muribaculaceae bacterium]|nr:hypothetical protein [Muribaculaceae bacterium]